MTDNQNVSDAAGQTTGQVRKVRASHARPATAPRAGQLASSRKPDLTSTLPKLEAVPAPQRQGSPVIVFDHVTKVYPAQPNKPALEDVSLEIYAGEFLFLVGHSGSGKSTFIKTITREVKPTSGHIYIANEDLSTMRDWRVPYLRRNIGCVFQDFKLLPNKTVFENVAFALEVIGKSRHVIKTQVPEVLRLVGLQEKMNKMPDQLSGGEQQRVSIARALAKNPKIILCDEPTGALDYHTGKAVLKLLQDTCRSTGKTVLIITHNSALTRIADRVIRVKNGTVIESGVNDAPLPVERIEW